MSKKLQGLIDNVHGPALLEEKQRLETHHHSTYVVENELNLSIQKVAETLVHFGMRDLRRVEKDLLQKTTFFLKSKLNALESGTEFDKDNQLLQSLLEIKTNLIEATIAAKNRYQRQFTHPVERNIIDHGLFSTTSPNESTLKKLRTADGVLERNKNGFRKLYYQNKSGKYLTPYDSKIFIGLFKMWMTKGSNKHFSFSFLELCREIGADPSGGEYNAIAQSLENISTTSIVMEEYLNPNTNKRTRTSIHNPVQNALIDRSDRKAEIVFNDYLHDSLAAGNYITINMALFNDLATPTSRNLYLNVINKLPDDIRRLDIDLLIEHLDLNSTSRTKSMNLIKQAFEELKDFDVIKSFDLEKKGRKVTTVYFEPSDWQAQQRPGLEVEQLSLFS